MNMQRLPDELFPICDEADLAVKLTATIRTFLRQAQAGAGSPARLTLPLHKRLASIAGETTGTGRRSSVFEDGSLLGAERAGASVKETRSVWVVTLVLTDCATGELLPYSWITDWTVTDWFDANAQYIAVIDDMWTSPAVLVMRTGYLNRRFVLDSATMAGTTQNQSGAVTVARAPAQHEEAEEMAVRITIEMFSGRPNPSWEISDPDRLGELRERLENSPQARGEVGSGYTGLGFGGVRVDFTEGDAPAGLPPSFELAGGGAKDSHASAELAQALVETIPRDLAEGGGIAVGDTSYAELMLETAREETKRTLSDESPGVAYTSAKTRQESELPDGWTEQMHALVERTPSCSIDTEPWSPGYWNHPNIQPYNNCYAYGVAYRSDTFAWPGREHGYTIPGTMYGYQVAVGLYKDGLAQFGYPCQPGSRRFLLALATGTYPETGVRDFHFHRYHPEAGFWSHKHAGNSARFVDNSGYVIRDPGVCDRGIYTEVYEYLFQSNDSVRIR
ncbi:hypothetical protein [Streptomyces virginiae]|uniref:Uncharacterized protein n=1 Tax=Streptomyces virginiae TaxID=1961 RepID=A0ABZ1TRX4_STRVG|nr:hypothetical protein [Streptomyces virginiae]